LIWREPPLAARQAFVGELIPDVGEEVAAVRFGVEKVLVLAPRQLHTQPGDPENLPAKRKRTRRLLHTQPGILKDSRWRENCLLRLPKDDPAKAGVAAPGTGGRP